jgi:hypothetical protein
MALDEADRNYIRDELRRVEDHLGDKIKLAEREMKSHLTDRFAHGWDHNQLVESKALVADWNQWRDGINKWRWMITGALVITSVEIPVVGALVASHFH